MGISAYARHEAAFSRHDECEVCGEDFGPNLEPSVEAFDICGDVICDSCAEQVFEDNGQFGVGA